jgi:hypothetical protein
MLMKAPSQYAPQKRRFAIRAPSCDCRGVAVTLQNFVSHRFQAEVHADMLRHCARYAGSLFLGRLIKGDHRRSERHGVVAGREAESVLSKNLRQPTDICGDDRNLCGNATRPSSRIAGWR